MHQTGIGSVLKEKSERIEGGRFWRSGKGQGVWEKQPSSTSLPHDTEAQKTGRLADGGERGAGDPGHGGGREVEQNEEEVEGNSFCSSPWSGMDYGGRSTTAGGLQPETARAALVVAMESSGRRGNWLWRCGTRWGAGPALL
jgi:hypothetical protein